MAGGSKYNLDGGGGGGGAGAPGTPTKPSGKVPGGSPGLLTSTGGLFGLGGQLLIPFNDLKINRFYLALIDPNDFNSEEASAYFFPQEDIAPGRRQDVHKLIVEYTNIGVAKVTFGVSVYVPDPSDPIKAGKFKTKERKITIGTSAADGLIYTIQVNLVISGLRPQAYITREADSGPMSINRVTMVGNSDEKDFM